MPTSRSVQREQRTAPDESARFRAFAQLGLDLVAEADSQGRYVWVSENHRDFVGRGPEELCGTLCFDLVHPDDCSRVAALFADVVSSQAPDRTSCRVRHRDGSWHWLEIGGTPFQTDSGEQRCLFVGRDVTDRLRDQEERRRVDERVSSAQKLESLGVLAGGIAHDFNNLLVGIQGNAQLALLDVESDAAVASMLRDIENASERAAALTRQLLAYAGKRRFDGDEIDLGRLMAEMRHRLVSAVPSGVLGVAPCETAAIVRGDEESLRQVISSFVTNAAEALSGASGRIEVSCGVMQADASYLATCAAPERLEPGEYAWVEVEDDGCGMDPSTRARIFDPFYTTKSDGRGLELAAALGTARSHLGTIHVASRPGSGTRIRVLVPVASALREPQPARVGPVGGRPAGADTVLVVDDDPSVRSVVRRMLQRFGHDVTVARDGTEAITRLREDGDRIGVVVLDVGMPGMDGEATYRALHQLRPDLPVIFSTGQSEADAAAVLDGKLAVQLLGKPFSLPMLCSAVARALGIATD